MALNAQMLSNYLRPTTFFEDIGLPETSGAYRSIDPFHFFENNLMREILLDSQDSDDHSLARAGVSTSAVSRPRLPYAKFSTASREDSARYLGATRPNSHDVSDNDEQTPQAPAPVVDMRVKRPPGNLKVVVNRPVPISTTTVQQRIAKRQKLNLKRHIDRVFDAAYDNATCMLACRVRSLGSSNMVEFILEH